MNVFKAAYKILDLLVLIGAIVFMFRAILADEWSKATFFMLAITVWMIHDRYERIISTIKKTTDGRKNTP